MFPEPNHAERHTSIAFLCAYLLVYFCLLKRWDLPHGALPTPADFLVNFVSPVDLVTLYCLLSGYFINFRTSPAKFFSRTSLKHQRQHLKVLKPDQGTCPTTTRHGEAYRVTAIVSTLDKLAATPLSRKSSKREPSGVDIPPDNQGNYLRLLDPNHPKTLPNVKETSLGELIALCSKRARRQFRSDLQNAHYSLSNETEMQIVLSRAVLIEAEQKLPDLTVDPFFIRWRELRTQFRESMTEGRDDGYSSSRHLLRTYLVSRAYWKLDKELINTNPGDLTFEFKDALHVSKQKLLNLSGSLNPLNLQDLDEAMLCLRYDRQISLSSFGVIKKLICHRDTQSLKPMLRLSSNYLTRHSSKHRMVNWPGKTDFLCYHCCRVLPRNRFAKGQMSGECLPGHMKPYKRFCISCGIQSGKFKPGNQININGCPFRFCQACSIPTFGKFCTQCNTCVSCLGFDEYTRPQSNTCPRCKVKTLRVCADLPVLRDFEERIYKARAFSNVLAACGCDLCMELVRKKWTLQPRPMDFVQQGLQFEIYHFSQVSALRPRTSSKNWQPAIIRYDGNLGVIELGFEKPTLNAVHDVEDSSICQLSRCGSSIELMRQMEAISTI